MRSLIAVSDNGGFTLVELMVAIAILMVGLMGLLQAVNVATSTNVANLVRNEAVRMGDQRLNESRSLPFDRITSHPARTVTSLTRSISKPFEITRTVTNLPTNATPPTSKQVQIEVRWQYKGQTYLHTVNAVVSN